MFTIAWHSFTVDKNLDNKNWNVLYETSVKKGNKTR